jgi:preprotein translocase subunit SecD
MVQAGVIDTRGGFALQIHFDEISARVLEQYSAANPGRHFAIFGQWGEKPAAGRWLAAPLITHRIADGILSFTPDMSREEAGRLALGLNNVAKKMRKGQLK